MYCVEVNPKGNFDTWQIQRLEELKQGKFKENLGQTKLYEDSNIRIWNISLDAGERFPFRAITVNISVTFGANGLGVCHHGTGKIKFLKIKNGDVFRLAGERNGKEIWDFENAGAAFMHLTIVEEKT